ncbi:hypothetical protein GQ55_9G373400 [Panicum hallii var. hallii]|uniref:Uncharacterized protein n=1 Tax=Panicum hallii var. hallii TaxID=1504633 RepID=A0A2T7C996_9POAL|nr:hypothetical protein GQ55_9G373400 [Panicum hallii var. hallii]
MQVELLRPMAAAGGRPRAGNEQAAVLRGYGGEWATAGLISLPHHEGRTVPSLLSLSSVECLLQLWRPLQCLDPAACNLFEQMREWLRTRCRKTGCRKEQAVRRDWLMIKC